MDEIEALKKENAELRAEILSLHQPWGLSERGSLLGEINSLKAELSAYKEGIKPEKAREGGDFILLFDTFGNGPRAMIGYYDKRYPNEPWGNEKEYYPEGNLIKIIPFDPFPHQQKGGER